MKKLVSFILCFAIIATVFTGLGISAFADSSGIWTYSVSDDGEATITGCDKIGAVGSIEIPAKFGDHPVTRIDDYVFYDYPEITEITVPGSVKAIGMYTFYGCTSLQSITLSEGLERIEHSFEGCTSLESITIPASVNLIFSGAFIGCSALESIEVSPENQRYLSKGNCLIDKSDMTLIAGCKNSVISDEDGILKIGDQAFYGQSKLLEIGIPNSVKTVGFSAFCECAELKKVTFGDGLKLLDDYSFMNCSSLTEIVLPDSLTTIGEEAFSGCTALSAVTTGKNLADIGNAVFSGCKELDSLTLSPGLKSIGYSAFAGCAALKEVAIPSGTLSIKACAFQDCTSLTDISIPKTLTELDSCVFDNTAFYNNSENWKNGVLYLDDCLLNAKSSQLSSKYTVKSGTRLIAAAAFAECKALKEVIVPTGVTVIGMQAFRACTNLAKITLPSALTHVESDSFDGTAYYKNSSNWQDSVLYIGNCLIKAKSEIPSKYAIKSGTRLIAAGAFDEAYNPDILTVPVSLKYICSWAFNDTYVQHIYYCGTKEQWGKISITYSEYIDYGEGNEEFTNPYCGNNILKKATMHYNTPLNKISFKGNGAFSCSIGTITALYNSRVKLPASGAKKTGYLFAWNTKADGKGTSYADKASTFSLTSKIGGNVTLYARWYKIYSITYKLNGGKNNKNNIKSYTKLTSTFTLKAPTRKGYTFKGWYSNKKLTKKVTKITKGSTGNKTLYAKWSKNTYKITYKLNGGKNSYRNPKKYTVTSSTITLKNPSRKGYTFKGWYSDSKFKTRVTKIKKGSTGNKTLYAKWKKK